MTSIPSWQKFETTIFQHSSMGIQRAVSAVEAASGLSPMAQARWLWLLSVVLIGLGLWGEYGTLIPAMYLLVSLAIISAWSIGYSYVLEQRVSGRRRRNPERLYPSAQLTRLAVVTTAFVFVWLVERWYEYVLLLSLVLFWYVVACDRR